MLDTPSYIQKIHFGEMNWKTRIFTFLPEFEVTKKECETIMKMIRSRIRFEGLIYDSIHVEDINAHEVKFSVQFTPASFQRSNGLSSLVTLNPDISKIKLLHYAETAAFADKWMRRYYFESWLHNARKELSALEALSLLKQQDSSVGPITQISARRYFSPLDPRKVKTVNFSIHLDPKLPTTRNIDGVRYYEEGRTLFLSKKDIPGIELKAIEQCILRYGKPFNPLTVVYKILTPLSHPAILLMFASLNVAYAEDKIAAFSHEAETFSWGMIGAVVGSASLKGLSWSTIGRVLGGCVGGVLGTGVGAPAGPVGMAAGASIGRLEGSFIGGAFFSLVGPSISRGIETGIRYVEKKIKNLFSEPQSKPPVSSSRIEEVAVDAADSQPSVMLNTPIQSILTSNPFLEEKRKSRFSPRTEESFGDRLASIFASESSSRVSTVLPFKSESLSSGSFITARTLSTSSILSEASRAPLRLNTSSTPILNVSLSRVTPMTQAISSTRLPASRSATQTLTPTMQFFRDTKTRSTTAAQWINDRFNC